MLFQKIILVGLLVLISCGDDEVNEDCNQVIGDICFAGNVPPEQHVLAFLAIFNEEVNRFYDFDQEDYFKNNQIYVRVVDGHLGRECENSYDDVVICKKRVSGINYGGDVVYITEHKECFVDPLVHEILHNLEYFFLDLPPSHKHETAHFFDLPYQACNKSIECSVIKRFCYP